MPKKSIPLVYWDACVFIDYIEGPAIGHPILLMRDSLLSKPKRVRIVTSTISIAEVAFIKEEKASGVLKPEIENKINALWDVASPIELIEVFAELCHNARELNRKIKKLGRSALGGADSLHLASAIIIGAQHFHTTNGKIQKLKDRVGDLVPFKIDAVCDVSLSAEDVASTEIPASTLFGEPETPKRIEHK